MFKTKVISKYELVEPSVLDLENYNLEDGGWMQLKALRSFGNVKKGDLGGFVKNSFLSQSGLCWIEKGCLAIDCFLLDNAVIKGKSVVEHVSLKDNAIIDNSMVATELHNNQNIIKLNDNAKIINCEDLVVMHKLELNNNAEICNINYIHIDKCTISGDTKIGNEE